ncbi:hypothetical protein LEP1GSC034_1795 [Leptospira interrogans str. 2003000735]|nr:hypothetical protein LEP1GSC007_4474 [Leptospira interrogans serovar Bulgarica str. Mallika]EJP18005.1 hypothetical protein LEP1GSC080_3656 [Leptospira interrogans str. FPW2026]EKN87380.1 hypothetical protein LEP1GSC027_2946 [Leptospira interrogans str. 2002000624]EKO94525.1 hypothetical protein LEP1GSC057_0604 [Leptospira interrogans str. Brem 329]EKP21000.1 hypothetical protein LEP1GSC117_1459 [Leptospira interrogans serovar Icterohaemorrhagiae str. Verdun LP]EKP77363.1 hypothetical prote
MPDTYRNLFCNAPKYNRILFKRSNYKDLLSFEADSYKTKPSFK